MPPLPQRAVVLTESGVRFESRYSPRPRAGWIPVRVLRAGVCETDLQLVQGYMQFRGVLGHEFVGVAETGRFAGQRVVGEINCSCRKCPVCLARQPRHCPQRSVLGILNQDGAFADRVWLPEENLHLVPDSVSNASAVFVEPLAAAFRIPEQLDLTRFSQAAVLGDGRLGTLCAEVLRWSGLMPLVVGKHEKKLDRINERGLPTALLRDVEKLDADLVVDCTGSVTGLPTAFRLARPGATIVLKTTISGDAGPALAQAVIDEFTILGSRCGPFEPALAALASGAVEVESLMTAEFPLEQITAALDAAASPEHCKVQLRIGT